MMKKSLLLLYLVDLGSHEIDPLLGEHQLNFSRALIFLQLRVSLVNVNRSLINASQLLVALIDTLVQLVGALLQIVHHIEQVVDAGEFEAILQ